jgi:hypothetical protein
MEDKKKLLESDHIPAPPPTPKQELVLKLNEIQATIQEVFYQLESYVEHDPGDAALVKSIELMDEIGKIRNRILRGEQKNGENEHKD